MCLGVSVIRRFEEKANQLDSVTSVLDLKTKAELKCLVEFTRWILGHPSIAQSLYFHYDLTGVKRALLSSLIGSSMKVYLTLDKNKTEDEGFKRYLKSFVSASIFNYSTQEQVNRVVNSEDLEFLKPLLEFLEGLSHIKYTVNEHPKRVFNQAQNIYGQYSDKAVWLPKFTTYLHLCPQLEGAKLTETIGAEFEDSQEMLDYFCRYLDFRGLPIVDALRKFFRGYHMTAEGAKIERVLGQFIIEYERQNPDHKYGDSDTQFYPFVFSLIVLNTDYHKKGDNSRMTFERYRAMVNGIYRGAVFTEEDILGFYNAIKTKEIKALKTNDLAYEDNITTAVWESTVSHQRETSSVMELILPEQLHITFEKSASIVRAHIPTLISAKINQIIQGNLFLMVESSYLNFTFVKDLYSTLLPEGPVAGARSHQSLIKTTDAFLDRLKVEETATTMVKSPQACWQYYCYLKWLLRVLLPAPEGCPSTAPCAKKFVSVLKFTTPLLTLILRDSVMTTHKALLSSVQQGTKYINLSKTKTNSLMDSLAGFMRKESSSDGEDPVVNKSRKALTWVVEPSAGGQQAQVLSGPSSPRGVAAGASTPSGLFAHFGQETLGEFINFFKQATRTTAKIIIDELRAEISKSEVNKDTFHHIALLLHLVAKLSGCNPEFLGRYWSEITDYLLEFHMENTHSADYRESLKGTAPSSAKKAGPEAKTEKLKLQLRAYSLLLLLNLGYSQLNRSQELPRIIDVLEEASSELLSISTDLWVDSVTRLSNILRSQQSWTQEGTVEVWANFSRIITKQLGQTATLNLNLPKVEEVCGSLQQILEFTFRNIVNSIMQKPTLLSDLAPLALEIPKILINAKCSEKMVEFHDMLEGFLTLAELIKQSLDNKDAEPPGQSQDITVTFSRRLLLFILSANQCNLTVAFKAVKIGLHCTNKANLSEEDQLKFMQMLNDCSSWRMDSASREELLNIFGELFSRSARHNSSLWPQFASEQIKLLAQSHSESVALAKTGSILRERVEGELRQFLISYFGAENPSNQALFAEIWREIIKPTGGAQELQIRPETREFITSLTNLK